MMPVTGRIGLRAFWHWSEASNPWGPTQWHNEVMSSSRGPWDRNAITVLPGLPGRLSTPDDPGPVYPASTLALVKLARRAGYQVLLTASDDLREVSHHSADQWLPLLNFGINVLAGGAGNVLAHLLISWFDRGAADRAVVHIRWQAQAADGSVRLFEFDGDSRAAIQAARIFEEGLNQVDDVD